MVEKVCSGDFGGGVIDCGDFGVDEGGLTGHGFEHGVGAEGVEIGASICEGEPGGDAL